MPKQHPFSPHKAGLSVGPLTGAATPSFPDRPETYRLPNKGGDPFFGLTRSWYYQAEQEGILQLIRIRKRGRQRGVTLVPYDDVAAIIAAAKQQLSSRRQRVQGGNA
jgi:hypothetical protein